jgi:hypothetical protein
MFEGNGVLICNEKLYYGTPLYIYAYGLTPKDIIDCTIDFYKIA